MSPAEFRQWWLKRHAPLARQMPGHLVDAQTSAPFDGVSELWFDSQQDFETAYASDIVQQVAADSIANVEHRERLLVEEHLLVPDSS